MTSAFLTESCSQNLSWLVRYEENTNKTQQKEYIPMTDGGKSDTKSGGF